MSRIGRRVDDPEIADVALRTRTTRDAIDRRVAALVRREIAGIGALAEEIVAGRAPLF